MTFTAGWDKFDECISSSQHEKQAVTIFFTFQHSNKPRLRYITEAAS
jgi:hypothetical protein